jgi:LysR family transcriptional regulator, transcription activator of glutamate synthase operon
LDISYIKEFIEMAKICNYTAAADSLYITQSTLYKHIKALELEIGEPLFEREGKHIKISKCGKKFLPYAQRILSAAELFMNEVKKERSDAMKVIDVFTQYYIMDIVQSFRQKFPTYMVHIHNMHDTVPNEQMDIFFMCNLNDLENKYDSMIYTTDKMAVVLYPSHPLACRESILLEELKNEDFIAITDDKSSYSTASICEQAGFTPRVVMNANFGSEVAGLVSEGLGIALLFKKLIMNREIRVVLVDIEPQLECTISVCWRNNEKLSEPAKRFVEFLNEVKKGKNW